ncbi:MFS transporter [Streptomyces sp. AV19]|uniref:MFS transporter n=1 Tax=Streptomyces sp. AV19 TaxID=2793068 RepID=UPI0018FE8D17|nr:MFS transporter [Streptomyces sp. AV19]MBH1935256.1 MFS transporter [Streptomyces sp. AV19]MDG4532072.1 MFS transporter [Streptomyces sp. AV19]
MSTNRPRTTLAISCAATLLVLLNFTAPLPAAALIGADLGAGASGRTWILGGIGVGLAASLMVAGSLADDHGRKRVFVAGGGLLALASAGCALATAPWAFVFARVVQGTAGAALLAAGLGLLGHACAPGPERARATGLWGAMVGGGIALGPVFSALVVRAADWRAVYWAVAAAAGALALWGAASLAESRNPRRRGFDAGGAVTLGLGVSLLVAALVEGRGGWARPHVLALLAAAAVALAAFGAVERRADAPLLDLALLRRPAFLASTVGALVVGAGVVGFMTYVPTAAQSLFGMSPLQSAGVLAIWSGLSFVAAPQARRLAGRVTDRHQVAAGLLACGVGQLALAGIGEHASWWRLVPGLVVAGLGSGVVNAALAGLAVRSVPADRVAVGSAANNASRYLGSSIGVALVATVLALAPQGGGAAHAVGVGMSRAALVTGVLVLAGAGLVALCRER